MRIDQADFFPAFLQLAAEGAARGWHEANGGNLSYRLESNEAAAFNVAPATTERRSALNIPVPSLAGERIALTASGARLALLDQTPDSSLGIIEVDATGSSYCIVSGFEGTQPTSELTAHLVAHDARVRAGHTRERVIYHAHCPHTVALSAVIEADVRVWSSTLWRSLSECALVVPAGIAALPYHAPGSTSLAQETAKALAHHAVCVWTNHGLLACACAFDDALDVVDTVEKAAGIYLQARAACGGREPNHLIDELSLRTYCTQSGIKANLHLLD